MGLGRSCSLQSETSICCKESLTKTRAVRFVDLGATQLEPSKPELNKSGSTTTSSTYRQRLVSGFESLPEFGPLYRWQRGLTAISTVLVVLNAIFIGWSVNVTLESLLRDEAPPEWIDKVEIGFAFALSVDLILRVLCFGKAFMSDPAERWWNLFDAALVAIAIFEPIFGNSADIKASRKFPALRIFRALRVLRIVRQLGTLRLMFAMITHAFVNVMWAFVFIMMFTFMLAVTFMQVTANKIDEFREDHPSAWMQHVNEKMPDEWVKKISVSYGNIVSSCVTLIASISGGLDWVEASWPLLQIDPMYLILYMSFVMFCVFGLMNILTGIFVANTKEVSEVDRDIVIRAQLKDRRSFANRLKNVLRSIDKDGSGSISKHELLEHLASSEFYAYLKTLDVTVSDAQGVFKLLDVNGTGEVNIDEFVLSLMRFQGSARAVDVATLLYEGKRNEARWNAYMDYIEEQFDVVKKRLRIDSSKVDDVQTHVSNAKLVTAFSLPLVNVDVDG